MPRLHSLGIHCGRPGLARGFWAHMAEGPHVELHLLGKMWVREAGGQVWIQGFLGPEPIPSCIQYPILYRTPPSHWSLWQVCVQRSMTILQAFQLYWANPSCRPRLKTPISGPYPSLPSALLHLVKLPPGSPQPHRLNAPSLLWPKWVVGKRLSE